jgi:hypothetical protein
LPFNISDPGSFANTKLFSSYLDGFTVQRVANAAKGKLKGDLLTITDTGSQFRDGPFSFSFLVERMPIIVSRSGGNLPAMNVTVCTACAGGNGTVPISPATNASDRCQISIYDPNYGTYFTPQYVPMPRIFPFPPESCTDFDDDGNACCGLCRYTDSDGVVICF